MAEIDRAVADDPLWSLICSMATFVAGMAHGNNQAIAFAKKYQSCVPDCPERHIQLGWAYFAAKRYDEALGQWALTAEMDKDPCLIARRSVGVRRTIAKASRHTRLSVSTPWSGTLLKPAQSERFRTRRWYAFTGPRDKAISAIQCVITVHDRSAMLLAVNPMLDNLHDSARFVALLHQVGLTL